MRRMTRERYLSDAELERFMRAVRERHHVNQPRDYALFAILANTGIRPEEARALRRCDVHPAARPPAIVLKRSKKAYGPYPVNRLVLHRAVARIVSEYLRGMSDRSPSALLFPFTKRQSRRLFHFYAHRAELPQTFRIYALRHAVGMRLWRVTRDLRIIQGVMGHIRLKASRAYQHVPLEDVLRAAPQAF